MSTLKKKQPLGLSLDELFILIYAIENKGMLTPAREKKLRRLVAPIEERIASTPTKHAKIDLEDRLRRIFTVLERAEDSRR